MNKISRSLAENDRSLQTSREPPRQRCASDAQRVVPEIRCQRRRPLEIRIHGKSKVPGGVLRPAPGSQPLGMNPPNDASCRRCSSRPRHRGRRCGPDPSAVCKSRCHADRTKGTPRERAAKGFRLAAAREQGHSAEWRSYGRSSTRSLQLQSGSIPHGCSCHEHETSFRRPVSKSGSPRVDMAIGATRMGHHRLDSFPCLQPGRPADAS